MFGQGLSASGYAGASQLLTALTATDNGKAGVVTPCSAGAVVQDGLLLATPNLVSSAALRFARLSLVPGSVRADA